MRLEGGKRSVTNVAKFPMPEIIVQQRRFSIDR
jgi:hypothetical protein